MIILKKTTIAFMSHNFFNSKLGIGLIWQNMQALLENLQHLYESKYPEVDARQPVIDHALVLLGASLDSIVVNIARKILLAGDYL